MPIRDQRAFIEAFNRLYGQIGLSIEKRPADLPAESPRKNSGATKGRTGVDIDLGDA